jgi:two-component system, NarL family, sensor kinase
MRKTAEREAIRDAKTETTLASRAVVAPLLAPALLRGDPAALRRMDAAVRGQVLGSGIVRVKLWSEDGRIVYSDERRLIGQQYALGGDELESLRTGGVDAELSDLSKPENRFERSGSRLYEVYRGVESPQGDRLLFEAYERSSSVAASGRRLWLTFLPALAGTLLLLLLLQLPLAGSLVRRLRRDQQERETLLQHAIEASERERTRIARDLHDGPVQSLAGVSYGLAAAADRAGAGTGEPAALAETLRQAAADTRRTIRELRGLLVDIYPPSLHTQGLAAALTDLLAPVGARGIHTSLDVDLELGPLTSPVEAVLYRTAQEAVRNAVEHGEPERIEVRVETPDGTARLTVRDDGKGFPGGDGPGGAHFGLRMMRDLARDSEGDLTIESEPGAGTLVRVEVPRR